MTLTKVRATHMQHFKKKQQIRHFSQETIAIQKVTSNKNNNS